MCALLLLPALVTATAGPGHLSLVTVAADTLMSTSMLTKQLRTSLLLQSATNESAQEGSHVTPLACLVSKQKMGRHRRT